MKKTKVLKTLCSTALVSAVLAFSPTANADLVTQLIHFDDAKNGAKWYSDADNNFLFDPTNLQSSTLCADSTESSGNGSCVIEGTQGVLPRMIRPASGPTVNGLPSQGHASKPPVYEGALSFTLDSFYFLLTGNGTGAANAISVAGSNGSSFTFQLGGTYSGPLGSPFVSFYEGANAGSAGGALNKQVGYIASFGSIFSDVTWIQFSAPTTAQVRLDCIVSTFDGTTTQPLSSFNSGCGMTTTQVPEPATLALFGFGLLGLGLSRRARKV